MKNIEKDLHITETISQNSMNTFLGDDRMKQNNIKKENENKEKISLGLDNDEQEMNGLYGMAETPEEDALHKEK